VLVTINRACGWNFSARMTRNGSIAAKTSDSESVSTHVGLAIDALALAADACTRMLIDKLANAGARTIVFDVLFRPRPPLPGFERDPTPIRTRRLGAAMARSRRVLIAQKLESSGANRH